MKIGTVAALAEFAPDAEILTRKLAYLFGVLQRHGFTRDESFQLLMTLTYSCDPGPSIDLLDDDEPV